jgi:hypothetical protein
MDTERGSADAEDLALADELADQVAPRPGRRGRGQAATSAARLASLDKARRALLLRTAGASFEQIAQALGYASRSGAYFAVEQALRRTLREPAAAVRQLALLRLDEMLRGLWPAITRGDVAAVGTGLRILERQAKYLGLDAPLRVDIEQTVRQMARDAGIDESDALAAVREAERYLHEASRAPGH